MLFNLFLADVCSTGGGYKMVNMCVYIRVKMRQVFCIFNSLHGSSVLRHVYVERDMLHTLLSMYSKDMSSRSRNACFS